MKVVEFYKIASSVGVTITRATNANHKLKHGLYAVTLGSNALGISFRLANVILK